MQIEIKVKKGKKYRKEVDTKIAYSGQLMGIISNYLLKDCVITIKTSEPEVDTNVAKLPFPSIKEGDSSENARVFAACR